MKTKTRKLSELSREELKDMFISIISGHDKEVEIAHMLAVHTAMKLPLLSAIKNELIEYVTDELIHFIESGVLKGSYDEEENVWTLILDSLEPDLVINIILDIDDYIHLYHKAMGPVNDLKLRTLRSFVENGGRQ